MVRQGAGRGARPCRRPASTTTSSQLVEHDLVRPVERRVVSGIIETRYRVVARSFQLDRRLFAAGSEETRAVLHETLVAVFDTARDEIELAIRLGAIDVAETRAARAAAAAVPRPRPAGARRAPPSSASASWRSSRSSSSEPATPTRADGRRGPMTPARTASSSRSTRCPPTPRSRPMTDVAAARRAARRRATSCASPTSAGCTSPRRSPTSATG